MLLLQNGCGSLQPRYQTGLEQEKFARLSKFEEIQSYLSGLAQAEWPGAQAELVELGRSEQGRPLSALRISGRQASPGSPERKLRVLLVGAQHGMEPSGAEALQILAREFLAGARRPMLGWMELLIVPVANPDGYVRNRRVNASGVNLSTDFGLLSAPESIALNSALLRYEPDVLLDIHESALLKKKSLGAKGYLTDFEAQYEYANNPNVDEHLLLLSAKLLLPEVLKNANSRGLPASHYIGEITDIAQPVTHGGLSARNLRNKAGLLGSVSCLLENRLDPSTGKYQTWRNIRERVQKQLVGVGAFLDTVQRYRREILAATFAARNELEAPKFFWPNPRYAINAEHPEIRIKFRAIESGEVRESTMPDHTAIDKGPARPLPHSCLIGAETDFFKTWLINQGIEDFRAGEDDGKEVLRVAVKGRFRHCLPLYLSEDSDSSIMPRLPFKHQPGMVRCE